MLQLESKPATTVEKRSESSKQAVKLEVAILKKVTKNDIMEFSKPKQLQPLVVNKEKHSSERGLQRADTGQTKEKKQIEQNYLLDDDHQQAGQINITTPNQYESSHASDSQKNSKPFELKKPLNFAPHENVVKKKELSDKPVFAFGQRIEKKQTVLTRSLSAQSQLLALPAPGDDKPKCFDLNRLKDLSKPKQTNDDPNFKSPR